MTELLYGIVLTFLGLSQPLTLKLIFPTADINTRLTISPSKHDYCSILHC